MGIPGVVWQVLAAVIVLGAFAMVLWDSHLRGRSTRLGLIVGMVDATLVVGAAILFAAGSWGGWLLIVAAACVQAVAIRNARSASR